MPVGREALVLGGRALRRERHDHSRVMKRLARAHRRRRLSRRCHAGDLGDELLLVEAEVVHDRLRLAQERDQEPQRRMRGANDRGQGGRAPLRCRDHLVDVAEEAV